MENKDEVTRKKTRKTTPTKPKKVIEPELPLVKPEKKKELERFWSSITIDNIHLLSDEDYESYRRWVYKKKKVKD